MDIISILKLKIFKAIYKKNYGEDWKKYFLNPYQAFAGQMPIPFNGDEPRLAEDWAVAAELGHLGFLDDL